MKKLTTIFLDILLRVLYIKPIFRLLKKHKLILIVLLTSLFFILIEWLKTFQIQEILEHKQNLLQLAHDYPLSLSLIFFFSYLLISTLSLPATAVFNVIGGFLFGFAKGVLLSIFALSIGSGFAFLLTRYFLRDFFIRKGGARMKKAYRHLTNNQIYYLFAFRLFPFTPLFFTNMIMGLSSIRFSVFYIVSFIALLPQLAIYANIGSQLSQLENLHGLMDPNMLLAFALIGLFPLSIKYLFRLIKRFKKSKEDLSLESDSALPN